MGELNSSRGEGINGSVVFHSNRQDSQVCVVFSGTWVSFGGFTEAVQTDSRLF